MKLCENVWAAIQHPSTHRLSDAASAVMLNRVASARTAKQARSGALETAFCRPAIPDCAEHHCLNLWRCHIRQPSQQPAAAARVPAWVVLSHCSCDVDMFCPIAELPSAKFFPQSVFRDLQISGEEGFVNCCLALLAPLFLLFCVFFAAYGVGCFRARPGM